MLKMNGSYLKKDIIQQDENLFTG